MAGHGWTVSVALGALLALAGPARAADPAPKGATAPDPDFLEFLGSTDEADPEFHQYLATTEGGNRDTKPAPRRGSDKT
ncbi:MAG: hypothetical protein JSR73_19290 [Proteobacteria bacterium]|nr:hypothetical protein [Pseudomonadota bacterium]